MASANLLLTQQIVNRFQEKISGLPIPQDGGMGPLTAQGVANTIEWVADGGGLFTSISSAMRGRASGISSIIGTGSSVNATAIMQQLGNINQVLTQVANELDLPAASAAPKPLVSAGGGSVTINPNTLNTVVKPPSPEGALTSLAKRLGLSTTQAVLFMGILGGVGFLAVKRMRER